MIFSLAQTNMVNVDISDEQLKNITSKYLDRLLTRDSCMEYMKRDSNNVLQWMYLDPEWRHGSVSSYTFRPVSYPELLVYNMQLLIKGEKIQNEKL